mmetsp:Transcript_11742/g.5896  ORF Transcript_11742/g.5896 Transcript_11742/m.5896 type:complete len:89 (-) Transcript_11742:58-324(-)
MIIQYPILKVWGYGIDWKEALVITYGGLRGAIGLTLALVVAAEHEIDNTVQQLVMLHTCSIAFLFLIINGTTTKALLNKLKMFKTTKL